MPPLSPHDFLLHVYGRVDDAPKALDSGRARGPDPTASDSEIVAIERVGEFRGPGTDRALYRHSRAYHRAEFPARTRVHRTAFARRAANLRHVEQQLHRTLAAGPAGADPVWLVDRLPVDACEFARAHFCRRLAGQPDFGYCHLRRRTFYGSRLHLRTPRDGVVRGYELAPARASEEAVLPELEPPAGTIGIGDRGSWSPALRDHLAEAGVVLRTPQAHQTRDPDRVGSGRRAAVRYRIETVNGQLAGRDGIERTWAKDRRHLCHRVVRKLLRPTVAVLLSVRQGHRPLQFDALAA